MVFKAYLLGFCKCVDLAFKELSKAHLHDMEDSWLDHYGMAVHLEDTAEDILGLLAQALGWMENFDRKTLRIRPPTVMYSRSRTLSLSDPYRDALISRLRLRIDYLICLDLLPHQVPRSSSRARRPPEQTRAPVDPVFDDVTPFLRQSMPPSEVAIPDHETAWEQMSQAIETLQELEETGHDLLTWEINMRSRVWRNKDLNIVRSLFKVSARGGRQCIADDDRASSTNAYKTSRADTLRL